MQKHGYLGYFHAASTRENICGVWGIEIEIVSVMVVVVVVVVEVIDYHGVGNLIILDEDVNADNHVRTLSENLLDFVESLFGDRNHPFVFPPDNIPTHTASQTAAWLEQQEISTIQWPI